MPVVEEGASHDRSTSAFPGKGISLLPASAWRYSHPVASFKLEIVQSSRTDEPAPSADRTGFSSWVRGVAEADAEAGPAPAEFTVRTSKACSVSLSSPVTTYDVGSDLMAVPAETCG